MSIARIAKETQFLPTPNWWDGLLLSRYAPCSSCQFLLDSITPSARPRGRLGGRHTRWKARTLAVCCRHLLLLALLLASSALARADDIAPPKVPRFEQAPCPKLQGAETLAKASCGYLVVPENRSRPNGRNIRLMVAKYPARSAEKRPDPVVYLAGGPGDIAPLEVNGFIAADFIRDRDIYAMSQRGTMFSEPALTCAASDEFSRQLLGLRFYSEATKRAHLAATEACHRELAATGADLSAYNSTESVA